MPDKVCHQELETILGTKFDNTDDFFVFVKDSNELSKMGPNLINKNLLISFFQNNVSPKVMHLFTYS